MAQAKRSSITRRHLMAASALAPLAAAAALPAPVSASASDPIFAAIAAHERAYADLAALFAAQRAAEKALQQAGRPARAKLKARFDDLLTAEGPLGLAEMKASARLVATIPQTLSGAAAALRYVRELFERDQYPLCEEDGYRALLFSTECALRRIVPPISTA